MTTLTIPKDRVPAAYLDGASDSGQSRAACTRTRRGPAHALASLGRLIQERPFLFLLATCAAAAFFPGPGRWLRGVSVGEASLRGEQVPLSLPTLMLAYMLFSAGLGVKTAQLRRMLRDPRPLFAGLVASFAIPVAFLVAASQLLGGWLGADHAGTLLVGLTLLAAVSAAPTSTFWVQSANGNLALSLGIVLLSTLLSPVRAPAVFRASGLLVQEDCARVLRELVACGAGALLIVAVILPSLLGLAVKAVLGEARVAPVVPLLKLVGPVNFLALTYANASAALPRVAADPDSGFLAMAFAVMSGLCLTTFAAGWGVARLLRADRGRQSALRFGLGMTNNSLAQALASAIAVSHPLVVALIVTHTLVQQLAAGVAALAFRRAAEGEAVTRVAVSG